MTIQETIKGLSDHQIADMVDVMLSDDFGPDQVTPVYLAAFEEAKRRKTVWGVLCLCHPNLKKAS